MLSINPCTDVACNLQAFDLPLDNYELLEMVCIRSFNMLNILVASLWYLSQCSANFQTVFTVYEDIYAIMWILLPLNNISHCKLTTCIARIKLLQLKHCGYRVWQTFFCKSYNWKKQANNAFPLSTTVTLTRAKTSPIAGETQNWSLGLAIVDRQPDNRIFN